MITSSVKRYMVAWISIYFLFLLEVFYVFLFSPRSFHIKLFDAVGSLLLISIAFLTFILKYRQVEEFSKEDKNLTIALIIFSIAIIAGDFLYHIQLIQNLTYIIATYLIIILIASYTLYKTSTKQ
ncbi:MAG: hypothetical protein DRO23_09250 [Thermoprotei archaeon]|nr:MAG: hypothetical protein DRO23_09250 [Thermoprotei archaeon]